MAWVSMVLVAFSACLMLCLGDPNPPPNLAQEILLKDEVDTHGARCLDGTPQRLWLQQATNPINKTKWYFHFMGGGWCESLDSCTQRAYDLDHCYIGSSSMACYNHSQNQEPGVQFNTTMDFRNIPAINGARWGGGLLMNTPDTNPLTHDWNKIEFQYCDGGSYGGSNETVTYVTYNNKRLPLYFRGQRNVEAALDHLVANFGLGSATQIVLSGDSAGGLATYWHADFFQERLPNSKVFAVPDSGFFLADPSKPAWPQSLSWIATQMNSSRGVDQSCLAATKNASMCTLPEDVSPHISTPLFVMNSRYDPALKGICTTSAVDYNTVGERVIATVNKTVLEVSMNNAAFLTSCNEHCGQWAQGQILEGHNDFNVTIDGWTAPYAVNSWVAALQAASENPSSPPARRLWIQESSYPCPQCCNGGN
eukprot:m.69371 g.69371  ORF g.69371 m.69371 type:complete len:423 (-) comp12050_c0_seq3:78-1346(-)